MNENQTRDVTALAIGLALAGSFLFVVQDAAIKWLSAGLAVLQILFIRNLAGLIILSSGALITGRRFSLRPKRPWLMLLRTLAGVVGWYCFFTGLKYLPLTTVGALFFTFPLFLTALSVPLLGERVGPRRWGAVIAGFCGVLLITRPGAELDWAMLLILWAAFTWALVAALTRKLGQTESPSTMVFYALVGFTIVAAVPQYWIWEPMSLPDLGLVVFTAMVGVSAQLCLIRAYSIAEPSIIGPIEYTGLIWAPIFGYLIWQDVPDGYVISGALIIVASGLYIIHRESGLFGRGVRR